MRKHFIFFVVLNLFVCFSASSQVNKARLDSLYNAFLKEKVDTSKVNLLLALAEEQKTSDPVRAVSYAREALDMAEHIGFQEGACYATLQIGDYYYEQVNYSEAVKRYLKASQLAQDNKMYSALCQSYNVLGIIYSNQGKSDQALKYFLKLAAVAEERNFSKRLSIAYNNIGITYKDLGRLSEASTYYKKALAEFEKTGFTKGIGSATNNLGIISHMQGNDEEALKYYDIAIQKFRELNDTASEAGIYTNIGELYYDKKDYQTSLDFYLKGLKIAERYKKNIFRGDAYEGVAKVYGKLKNYEKAYFYNVKYHQWQDSLRDEDGMRQVAEMERRVENEKREHEIELLKQKKEIQDLKVRTQSAQLKQSRIVIYSVAGILLIVLLMSFFLFKAYRQIKKTNKELAETKQEIQDSINYAKHIQEAMLPDVSVLGRHFPEGFGLYLPKDVVSGDFYWMNELGGNLYFAVADCTGHGVPGAFMSMIGIDKLNQSLIDKELQEPAAILSSLNISIKQALKQKDDQSGSKDGMDIAICSYNKTSMKLNYAGANRPLWLIRGKELFEYKPTKASIAGYTDNAQVYASHEINLQAGDALYLFTDGYPDQFGGPEKKKFMTKRLKQLLIEIHGLPMSKQEIRLQENFNEWKATISQVDDVLVLGFRI
jgi:serine phosphatase RsbU (regulator of sigma subunit)/Flp pilus assembly protein TadD